MLGDTAELHSADASMVDGEKVTSKDESRSERSQ